LNWRSALHDADARVPSSIRGEDAGQRLAIYGNTIRGTS
jgi:hypothetical protein